MACSSRYRHSTDTCATSSSAVQEGRGLPARSEAWQHRAERSECAGFRSGHSARGAPAPAGFDGLRKLDQMHLLRDSILNHCEILGYDFTDYLVSEHCGVNHTSIAQFRDEPERPMSGTTGSCDRSIPLRVGCHREQRRVQGSLGARNQFAIAEERLATLFEMRHQTRPPQPQVLGSRSLAR